MRSMRGGIGGGWERGGGGRGEGVVEEIPRRWGRRGRILGMGGLGAEVEG